MYSRILTKSNAKLKLVAQTVTYQHFDPPTEVIPYEHLVFSIFAASK